MTKNEQTVEITYPHVEAAGFRPWGAGWVVALPADELDIVLKAGGITVTKADGSTTRRLVTGVKELKSGKSTWTFKGVEWSALETKIPAEDKPERAAKAASTTSTGTAKVQAQPEVAAVTVDPERAKVLAELRAAGFTPAEVMSYIRDLDAERDAKVAAGVAAMEAAKVTDDPHMTPVTSPKAATGAVTVTSSGRTRRTNGTSNGSAPNDIAKLLADA